MVTLFVVIEVGPLVCLKRYCRVACWVVSMTNLHTDDHLAMAHAFDGSRVVQDLRMADSFGGTQLGAWFVAGLAQAGHPKAVCLENFEGEGIQSVVVVNTRSGARSSGGRSTRTPQPPYT